jgi:hypothetical protein
LILGFFLGTLAGHDPRRLFEADPNDPRQITDIVPEAVTMPPK